jgi:hypothetical protein
MRIVASDLLHLVCLSLSLSLFLVLFVFVFHGFSPFSCLLLFRTVTFGKSIVLSIARILVWASRFGIACLGLCFADSTRCGYPVPSSGGA